MSVIIRLQNLPWSANSFDIRQYFQGLSIPEGGVHIVGGELGDAFIAFSTDEDARQAMMLSGGKLKEVQVSLMLSSRSEMQKVIEAARSMTFPPMAQPGLTAAPLAPQQSLPSQLPTGLPPQAIKSAEGNEPDEIDLRESRKRTRSRSRSRDRSRSGRKDVGRRRRSRSRDRDRSRRKRSRSRGRDRYGRDLQKRDEFVKEKGKDDFKADGGRKDRPDKPPDSMNDYQAPKPMGDPFGLRGNAIQMPLIDDRLTAAMRSTLSALNLPLPASLINDKNSIPGLGSDTKKDIAPSRSRFSGDANNGPDVSPGHGGFPDPGPAFGPSGRGDMAPAFSTGSPFGGSFNRNDMGPGFGNLPYGPNQNSPFENVNNDNMWPNQPNNMNRPFPPMGGFNMNMHDGDDRNRTGPRPNFNRNDGMDDNFPSRFIGKGPGVHDGNPMMGGPFGFSRGNNDGPMSNNLDHRQDQFSGPMGDLGVNNRDFSRFERGPRPNVDPQIRGQSLEGRPMFMGRSPDELGRPNNDMNRRSDFRDNYERGSSREKWRDNDDRNIRRPNNSRDGNCAELINCPCVPYKEIRRAFNTIGCNVEEIKFDEMGPSRRVGVKFSNFPSKMKAVKMSDKVRIGGDFASVSPLSEEEFYSFREGRGVFRGDGDRRQGSRRRGSEDDFNDDRQQSRHDIDYDDENNEDFDNSNFRDNEGRSQEKGAPDQKKENTGKKSESRWSPAESDVRKDKTIKQPGKNIKKSLIFDCVLVSNLPIGTTDRDICDFFSDIGLTPKKLHIMLDGAGEPSGEAYVEFWHEDQAKMACGKDGAPMGRLNVVVRLADRDEMLEAVGLEADDINPKYPLIPNMGLLPVPQMRPMGPNGPMNSRMAGAGPGPMPLFPVRPTGPRGPMFPSDNNFRGPMPNIGPLMPTDSASPPSPDRVVTMDNIPYRANTDEIIAFFGHSFDITPSEVFRKMNERGQPTSEARVVMPSAMDAERAVNTLNNKLIHGRLVKLMVLQNVL